MKKRSLFERVVVAAVVISFVLLGQTFAVQASPEGKVTFLSAENLLGRWNPYQHTNLAHYKLEEQVLEKLADVSVEDPNELVPRLAVSWSIIDPLTWEVKLRKGVKFHDGTPFDGEDIKASIEYGSDADKTLVGRFFAEKVKVEVKDPYTVLLKTSKPNAALISTLLMLRICSSEDIANPEKLDERMNGTGPYKWVSYSEAEGVRVTADIGYWDGAPKVKDFYFRYVGDETTRLSALLSGEAQIIDRVGPEQLAIIEKSKGSYGSCSCILQGSPQRYSL
jgi:peptide/nickel transport system substrate-binding protein